MFLVHLASLLDRIVAAKLREIAQLESQAEQLQTNLAITRSITVTDVLQSALRRLPGQPLRIIAECKRASPSRGLLRADYQLQQIADSYTACGAAAISVLTDAQFFQGSLTHIAQVRQVSSLPILRKDFILAPLQIYESVHAGANAILLIVRLLSFDKLQALYKLARQLSLDVLVEVHNQAEAEQAIALQAEVIGINHRDLDSLTMDLSLTPRLAPLIRQALPDTIIISESGVESTANRQQVDRFVDGILIGTALMQSNDIHARWQEIFYDRERLIEEERK